MKLDLSDGMSNHSDFSNDSANSQMSTADFMTSMGNGILVSSSSTLITLEGLHSGVPTITTPTLTPTTLRSIEQTFIELQSKPESHENEAGFVPPLVHSIGNNQYISVSDVDVYSTKSNSNLWPSSLSQSSSDSNTRPTPPVTPKSNILTPAPQSSRRNMGGRKPQKDINITPEEEERRRIRRERNKAAAARCRKRRVDHTNALIEEVDQLEKRKSALQAEYDELREVEKQLEEALESHRLFHTCRLSDRPTSPPDVKPFAIPQFVKMEERVKTEMIEQLPPDEDHMYIPPAKKIMLSSTVPISKPSRPNSLNVAVTAPVATKNLTDLGIAIQTPSAGMHFNFESLMVGGTGLTPVTTPLIPNCSTQQRIPVIPSDIGSPESCNPPKLVSL